MNFFLPNQYINYIYYGPDASQFEDASGIVTNRAPKQIQANLEYLTDATSTVSDNSEIFNELLYLLGSAPAYSNTITYNKYEIVSDSDGSFYSSLQDNNLNKELINTTWWLPVLININDLHDGVNTTWSSLKIYHLIKDHVYDWSYTELFYLVSGNAPVWSSSNKYNSYDIVQDSNTNLYVSLQNLNSNNELNDTSWWKPISININDNVTNNHTGWSSYKLNQEFSSIDVDFQNLINDGTTSTTTTWSSNKINEVENTLSSSISNFINDSITDTTHAWSSTKITNSFSNLNSQINSIINDSVTQTTTGWSSNKIYNSIITYGRGRLR